MAQHETNQVCPESIACLVPKRLIVINEADAGVALLFLCDTYIRSFELNALKKNDVMVLLED